MSRSQSVGFDFFVCPRAPHSLRFCPCLVIPYSGLPRSSSRGSIPSFIKKAQISRCLAVLVRKTPSLSLISPLMSRMYRDVACHIALNLSRASPFCQLLDPVLPTLRCPFCNPVASKFFRSGLKSSAASFTATVRWLLIYRQRAKTVCRGSIGCVALWMALMCPVAM